MSHPAEPVKNHPLTLDDFPIVVRLPVQWGDQDAYGHVNNTLALRWFETGRIAYLGQPAIQEALKAAKLEPILASATCHYRRQIKFPDTVAIGTRVSRIGGKSFVMEHLIVSESQQAPAIDGTCVVVAFDYAANESRLVPESLRQVFAQIEGHRLG